MSVLLVVASLAVVASACGAAAPGEQRTSSGEGVSTSVLVVDGEQVGEQVKTAPAAQRQAERAPRRRRNATARRTPIPAPPLLTDGSIDDGPDPFLNDFIPVQPIPVEDDGSATGIIDAWSEELRNVQRTQWDRWMRSGTKNPWGQTDDVTFSSLVKVTVEHCGGSRTVASGVVLGRETVVTTVHAIENASMRVRVAPALGETRRLPAMIRYLDIDDDVAVLKVPGLTAPALEYYQPRGSEPQWGFAYGVGRGSRTGSVRRVPAIVTMRPSSLTLEQPDGLAEQITDRTVQTMVAGVDTGASGGIVTATDDPDLVQGFGFHGLIRARVPFRSNTGGIVVPSDVVRQAVTAANRNERWFEIAPGSCPQWHR